MAPPQRVMAKGFEAMVRNPGLLSNTLVVFVHGNGLCASTFRQTVNSLVELTAKDTQRGLHMLSLDLPGHGSHELAGQSLDHFTKLSQFAKPLERSVQQYCNSQAHVSFDTKILVAHSIGCHMTLFAQDELAFDKALLIEPIIAPKSGGEVPRGVPPGFPDKVRKRRSTFPSYRAAFDTLRTRGMFVPWDTESVKNYVFHGGFREVPHGVELSCNPNLEANIFSTDISEIEPELKNIRFKACTVLAGAKSPHLPSSEYESTARKLGAEFVLLPDTDHNIMAERPRVVAEYVHQLMMK